MMKLNKYFDFYILFISLLTSWLLWTEQGQMLIGDSLIELYKSRNDSESLWLQYLSYFSDNQAILFVSVLSAFSLYIFSRIGLLIGLSKKTTFILFLLLNFNPEYNDARLNIEPFQLLFFSHLLSIYGFLQTKKFIRSLIAWAIPLWLSAFISPLIILWNLIFPIFLLFYPQDNMKKRIRIITFYYFIAALLIYIVPNFSIVITALIEQFEENINRASFEMSVFFSSDVNFLLTPFDGFMLSVILIIANALKISGILIVILMLLAFKLNIVSVLSYRVKYFFSCLLIANLLLSGLLFLYSGHLLSDLVYMPLIVSVLYLCSAAIFWLQNQKLNSQSRLVFLWIGISYALASIIMFGPSADYKKEAGEWAKEQKARSIYSNSREVLYYSDNNPLLADFNIYFLPDYSLSHEDLILYAHNRKVELPESLDLYEIIKTFSNKHGDMIYALRLKNVKDK